MVAIPTKNLKELRTIIERRHNELFLILEELLYGYEI